MDDAISRALRECVTRASTVMARIGDEVAERRALAVSTGWVTRLGDAVSPVPVMARPVMRIDGRLLDPDEEVEDARRVHFDAEGRPLLVEDETREIPWRLWTYEAGYTEEVVPRAWSSEAEVTRLVQAVGGEPIGAVGNTTVAWWAQRWRWRGGRLVRLEGAEVGEHGWYRMLARDAEYSDDGAIVRVLVPSRVDSVDEPHAPLSDEERIDVLASALDLAAGLVCDQVGWVSARDMPRRLRRDTDGMGHWLAERFADAIATAAAEAAIADPFCVHVLPSRGGGGLLPPHVRVSGDAWRRRIVEVEPVHGAAIVHVGLGESSGHVAGIDLSEWLDDDVLRACAEISEASRLPDGQDDHERSEVVLEELVERLEPLLLEPGRIGGATPDFLPLVMLERSVTAGLDGALGRVARIVGDDRVLAFKRSVESHAAVRRPPDPELVRRALGDRTALAALLESVGLEVHAARLAHDIAEEGFLLVPSERRSGGSRLGGPALLPPGRAWPTTDGEPLTFLAGIDLAELPRRGGWPAAGWWLFFARLTAEGDDPGFWHSDVNRPDGPAQVLHIPPGVAPETADTPPTGVGVVLEHVLVDLQPVLTIPTDYEAPERLGLDEFDALTYQAAVELLDDACSAFKDEGRHWVRGHATGVQHHPHPGTDLMLLMDWDENLGFEFMDGGTIQFRIRPDALARRDYSGVVIVPDSC